MRWLRFRRLNTLTCRIAEIESAIASLATTEYTTRGALMIIDAAYRGYRAECDEISREITRRNHAPTS